MKLYAWVNPLSFTSKLDHTWVTGYDTRTDTYQTLEDVVDAGQLCWLCWGDFHPFGKTASHPDGFLLDCDGDQSFAECLVEPNASSIDSPPARGTIFEYGIDGVCHQLANQVLYAANVDGTAPTVKDAKGYWLSSLAYTTYGRQKSAWREKIAGCGGNLAADSRFGEGDMPDQLIKHAQEVLGADDPAVEAIVEHQQVHQAKVLDSLAGEEVTAEQINARNREMMANLQDHIGKEKFVKVFGVSAEDAPDLVDPSIFAASRRMRPDPA